MRDPLTPRAKFGTWALVEVLTTVENVICVVFDECPYPCHPSWDGAFQEYRSQLSSAHHCPQSLWHLLARTKCSVNIY